jgi:LysR family transcriptional regulator, transcription activator of glutamate synthase operon
MNLNLLQLRYFQMVARLEHITKAAEALAIAQPSLSKTISQLEEALGVPLFDRVGRQIRLNRFGKALLSHVERVFDELEQAQREMTDLENGESGVIDLAIHAGTQFLPGLLSAFREHHPHIHFRVSQHAAQSALEKLERGEVRLCVTCLPLSRPDIDSLPLLTEDILLAVPSDHPLAPRASFSLEEIVDEPFVTLTPGYPLREITQALWEHHGLNPQIAFEVNNPGTIPALIKARLGIGFVPALTWHDVLTSLVLLPVEGATLQRTLIIAWHRGSYLSQAERLFRDFVVDYCVHSDILRAKSTG